MVMGPKDTSYEDRVDSNKERKLKETGGVKGSSQVSTEVQPVPGDDADDWVEDYNGNDIENDTDFTVGKKYKKKNTVLIELPRTFSTVKMSALCWIGQQQQVEQL